MTTHADRAAAAPRWVTMFNPIARPLLAAGLPMAMNGLITVRGRRSGEPRSAPVAIISMDGRRWIWAPFGDVNWVKNLRAAGGGTLTFRRKSEAVAAMELDEAARVAFFRDVLGPVARRLRFGMWFVRTFDRTDLSDPVAAAKGRVVFELLPAR
jgi:deazaflavin-dependent oxidoreductase (nitroreductase family)